MSGRGYLWVPQNRSCVTKKSHWVPRSRGRPRNENSQIFDGAVQIVHDVTLPRNLGYAVHILILYIILKMYKDKSEGQPKLLVIRQRPYQDECTASRSISVVKHLWVWSVLGWVTAWEHQMLLAFYIFIQIFPILGSL